MPSAVRRGARDEFLVKLTGHFKGVVRAVEDYGLQKHETFAPHGCELDADTRLVPSGDFSRKIIELTGDRPGIVDFKAAAFA
jgi:hypothetical protein